MATTLLEDLADRIRPYVRQCPFDTINQVLIDIMRDFYNFTRAYQAEDTETVQALVSDYDINIPDANVEPIALEQVLVDGFACFPKTPAWLTQYVDRNWRLRQANDFRYYTTLTPQSFTFACVPTKMGSMGGVFYRASYRPTLQATGIDNAQVAEWSDAWSTGALWRLKEMGGTPAPAWQDLKGAGEKRAEYRQLRGEARIRVAKAYGNTTDRFIVQGGLA